MTSNGFDAWWATQVAPLARVVKNSDCLPFKEVAREAWMASEKFRKEDAQSEVQVEMLDKKK